LIAKKYLISCSASETGCTAGVGVGEGVVLRRKLLIGLLSTLAGCVSTNKRSFTSGRLAIKIEATPNTSARAISADFDLQGTPSTGQLSLSGPLGAVLVQAIWSPQQAVLRTPGSEQIFTTLDELTQSLLGEILPVAALFDWLRGNPWPQASSQPTMPPQPQGFQQLGWAVDTSRLPDRWLIAQRTQVPTISIKARIDP
jgi:outer membrane lipoprotein LolB